MPCPLPIHRLFLLLPLAACGSTRPPPSDLPSLAGEARVAWGRALAASVRSHAADAAALPDGGLVVAGDFAGTMTAGGRSASARGGDGFVAWLDSGGAVNRLLSFGGGDQDLATAVAVGPGGSVAVAGQVGGPVLLGKTRIGRAGAATGFVGLLDNDGRWRWVQALESSDPAFVADLTFAEGGLVVAGGFFTGSVSVGDIRLTSAGNQDVLVAAFGAGGKVEWARRAGGKAADHGRAVSAAGGHIYLTGGFARTADFAGAQLASNYNQDGFLASLTTGGKVEWVDTFGGTERDLGMAVAAGADGVAVGCVSSSHDADFGTGKLDAGDGLGAFVAEYSVKGEPRWAVRLGSGAAEVRALARTPRGILAAGTFTGVQQIGGTRVEAQGQRDLFVALLDTAGKVTSATALGGDDFDDLAAAVPVGDAALVAGTYAGSLRAGGDEMPEAKTAAAFAARLQP